MLSNYVNIQSPLLVTRLLRCWEHFLYITFGKVSWLLCFKCYEKGCVAGKKESSWVLFNNSPFFWGENPTLTFRSAIHTSNNVEIAFVHWKSWRCHQTLCVFGGVMIVRWHITYQHISLAIPGQEVYTQSWLNSQWSVWNGHTFSCAIPREKDQELASSNYFSSLHPIITHFLPNLLTSIS